MGIDRHEIVAAADLHAMAGVIDQSDLRARCFTQEVTCHLLHRHAVKVDAFDGKADFREAPGDRARVIGRIGRCLHVGVGVIADYQCDAPAGRRLRRGRRDGSSFSPVWASIDAVVRGAGAGASVTGNRLGVFAF